MCEPFRKLPRSDSIRSATGLQNLCWRIEKGRTLGEAVIVGLEGAGILIKFIRYEAHIDRMLSRSIRELERVQEKRKKAESIIDRDEQD